MLGTTKSGFPRTLKLSSFCRFNSSSDTTTQLRTSNTLKKTQFDLKYYSDNIELFKDICKKRNVAYPLGNDFPELYQSLKDLKNSQLELKHQMKKSQDTLKSLKIEQKKTQIDNSDAQGTQLKLLENLKPLLKNADTAVSSREDELNVKVDQLPNLIDPSVDSSQILVEFLNLSEKTTKSDPDYTLAGDMTYDHKTIMENLNIVEFQQATKISGRGWYYLLGDGALLEQALVQYALKLARKAGFRMALPPSIVKSEVTSACGFKPRDTNNERQVYELTHDQLCLTGTAEIPLAALHIGKYLGSLEKPLRMVGLSRSYRAEAGAAGRDTRGLYRVHEFTKVELFSWTQGKIEESNTEFDRIVEFQKSFVKELGLPARVLIMPYDDLGAPAYKKIDIEVFMRGRGNWGEVSSTSNCLDYQSRRLSSKYRDKSDGKLKYVHTLNGTACAVPRVVLAIVENYFDPETNSILIPEVLRPYMDDKERITLESW